MCLGSERRQHSLLLHTPTTQRLGQVSDALWTHISRGKKGHRSVCLLLAPIRGGGEAGSLGDARVWQLRTPAGHSGAPVTARWGRPHGRSWDGSIRKEQGDRHAALGVGPRAPGDPAHPLCLCPPDSI